MVGAAVIGGAVIGGVASNSAADKAADASESAADAQARSGQASIDFQRESRDIALGNLSPFINFATGSIYGTPTNTVAGEIPQSAKTFENFDWQAYLRANPDVADPKKWSGHGATPAGNAWAHYQTYGRGEGRQYTALSGTDTGPRYDQNSPMAKYLELLDPQKQSDYLTNNPIFQAAINQFGTKAKNTLGFGGLKGDLSSAIAKNYMATGNDYVNSQLNRLLAPIQVGQNSAAGSASASLTAGTNIGNTMTDIGNANASGIIGASNARTAGTNSLLNFGSQLAGAYLGSQQNANNPMLNNSGASGNYYNNYSGYA